MMRACVNLNVSPDTYVTIELVMPLGEARELLKHQPTAWPCLQLAHVLQAAIQKADTAYTETSTVRP